MSKNVDIGRGGDKTAAHELSADNSSSSGGSPLSLLMPAQVSVLNKARVLVSDTNLRIDELVTCISKDPVILLEVLRVANAMFSAGDRPPITTPRTAVVRLGSANVEDIIEHLVQRNPITEISVSQSFETLRTLGRRISGIARIISENSYKEFADDAAVVGSMSVMGQLIACLHFRQKYVELSSRLSRASFHYKLATEHHFDVRAMRIRYLKKQGFPANLLFALDREQAPKSVDRIAIRFIVESAEELVDAFDHGKWEKYAPGTKLPSQSSIRLLQLSDSRYENIYQLCTEYLTGFRQRQLDGSGTMSSVRPTSGSSNVGPQAAGKDVHHKASTTNGNSPAAAQDNSLPTLEDAVGQLALLDDSTIILSFNGPVVDTEAARNAANTASNSGNEAEGKPLTKTDSKWESFAFSSMETNKDKSIQFVEKDIEADDAPQLHTEKAQAVLAEFCELCSDAETAEELLKHLLDKLICDGPFMRAALIVLGSDRRSATIHTAVGDGLQDGSEISLNDPLSPVINCLTNVKSFNAKGLTDLLSPLGITSYAISPLNVENSTPVVLYADCGEDGSLAFDARRIFRYVVGLINNTLPNLPGGLPTK